jgi:C-terminal processing protease CtpA/Prc
MRGMRRFLLALGCVALTMPGYTQSPDSPSDLGAVFSFETEHGGTSPRGWGGGPPGTIFVDGAIVHEGRWSARLERDAASPGGFSTITKAIPMDFTATSIEWRGFLRSEGVSEFLGLWMRQDGDTPSLAFDNMQKRQVKGTHDWTEYSITLPVHRDAKQLYVGVLLAGTGKVWADGLQLLADGRPVWDAPRVERPKTAIDLDHEFDGGSGIVLRELTTTQIESLTLLGKVWGFLKYHHPRVTEGKHHWDYELFRVLPKVLAAANRDAASAAVRDWVRGMGDTTACTACTTLKTDNLHFGPELEWITRDAAVGRDLADVLRTVHRDRPGGKQFYVSQAPAVGNPVFEHELAYAGLRFPDAGYQLLALYRFWNIVRYWYPNRNVLDQDWGKVLADFIPRIALARDKDAYQLEAIALIAKVTDTHANLWSAPPQLRPPAGACQLPVTMRFIEHRAVVTGYSDGSTGPATGLKIGDVIERLDGVPVQELVDRWTPYYPASNGPTRLRDIARSMTRGPCSAARAGVRRDSQMLEITAQRQPLASLDPKAGRTHDLPGDTFRLLSDEVAYLKLSSVQAAHASSYIERAQGTKGLVIDIRNYPSEFVVFALGSHLVDRPAPFARFTVGDLDNPGAFRWLGEPLTLRPEAPRYSGRVVILVDEVSQSQAEYTAMAFRCAPQSVVVGSTTAGADGNVSQVPLPGGLSTMISGIGVFYPDKTPTQRVGIVPDVEVRPTIAGIRAGRDEVLEEALRQVLGRGTPADQIEKMARGGS